MKRRVFYVDVIRSVACILVVSSHVFAPICAGMNTYPRSVWWVFNLFDSIIRPSAALYIMISGKIFLGSAREDSYFRFVWKRARKILLPFFTWSMLYALYETHLQGTSFAFERAVLQFLRGPTEYHLWFMYVILGLYLVMPLMRRFVRSTGPVGLVSVLSFWIGFLMFQSLLPQHAFTAPASLLISYGGYAFLGYALDKDTVLDRKMGASFFLWLGIVLFNAAGTFLLTIQKGGIIDEKLYFGAAPLVAIQAAMMFLLLKNAGEGRLFQMSWIRRAITLLGQNSYNIYLNHALILSLFVNGLLGFVLSQDSGPNPYIGVSLTSVIVLCCSLGLTMLLQSIPLASKLFVITPPRDKKPMAIEPPPPLPNSFPQTTT